MSLVSFAEWFNPALGMDGSKESKLPFRIHIDALVRFMALAIIPMAGCVNVNCSLCFSPNPPKEGVGLAS